MSTTVYLLGEAMLELAPVGEDDYHLGVAGDSFNTAVALSGLGIETEYVSATGDGPTGKRIGDALARYHVGSRFLQELPGCAPGLYLIAVDANGERSFSYWRGNSAARQLFQDSQKLESALSRIEQGQWLYLTGISLAIASADSRQVLLDFIVQYREAGGRFAFDCNHRPALWPDAAAARNAYRRFVAVSDVFLPGADDLADAWALAPEAVTDFLTSLALPCTVLKQGGGDVLLVEGSHVETIACERDPAPADTTGAGDAFNGAFIAATLQGLELADAIGFAHAVASDVVRVHGAQLSPERWAVHRDDLAAKQ